MEYDLIGSRVYCCFKCRNIIALHDDIVNKNFVAGRGVGRAFLFSHVKNIVEGPKADRQLITGVHMVADVFCSDCGEYLGWKYDKTYEPRHEYKEGKTVICKRKIAKAVDPPTHL